VALLGPVVQVLRVAVFDGGYDLAVGGAVGAELVVTITRGTARLFFFSSTSSQMA
jgi:hypothetical protein